MEVPFSTLKIFKTVKVSSLQNPVPLPFYPSNTTLVVSSTTVQSVNKRWH